MLMKAKKKQHTQLSFVFTGGQKGVAQPSLVFFWQKKSLCVPDQPP